MRIGSMRKRVTFQERAATTDTVGGQTTAWADVAVVWAGLAPSVGKELLAAQVMKLEQPTTITLRWQPAFADPKRVAAMRAVYSGRFFDIHSVQNTDERNRELTLIATEGMSDG